MGVLYFYEEKTDTIGQVSLTVSGGTIIIQPGGDSSGGSSLGSAVFFSGKTPGSELVPADGSIFSGNDYSDGLTQFGSVYGGDGTSTFGVPDLRSAPPFYGGRWMVNIGADARKAVRIYCGLGYYCGANNLYAGSLLPSGD